MNRVVNGISFFIFMFHAIYSNGQNIQQLFKASGTPVSPKVSISWNRYYDSKGLETICKKIAEAYPHLAKLESIGKSYQGKNLWCLNITDFKKGNAKNKPAIYIQGNIHGNELQGSEFALYTAWYLTESFIESRYIQKLLNDKIFYIVPSINPDARDYFIHNSNNSNSSRFSMMRSDMDGDGKFGEDPPDDLDKDGNITQMRIKNPIGGWKIDSSDARIMRPIVRDSIIVVDGKPRAKYPNAENYDILTEGGLDNDNDGKIDEDGIGSDSARTKNKGFAINDYDLNRNWGYNWEPHNTDSAVSLSNSFSYSETKAVRSFFLHHSNITIAQDFHNPGGYLFPGTSKRFQNDSNETPEDVSLINSLGINGERLLPGYKFYLLDNVYRGIEGRAIDWMFGKRGVYSFIVELMPEYLFYNNEETDPKRKWREAYQFDQELLFNDGFIPWHTFNHPKLGKVEIGGFKKNFARLTPGFLMEYEAHRNMAFSLYLCNETPKLEIKKISVSDIGNEQKEVIAIIANTRLLPTHSGPDIKYSISGPDYINLQTKGKVVSVAQIEMNKDSEIKIIKKQNENLSSFKVDNIPGHSEVIVKWIVEGNAEKYTVTVKSVKGGIATASANNK